MSKKHNSESALDPTFDFIINTVGAMLDFEPPKVASASCFVLSGSTDELQRETLFHRRELFSRVILTSETSLNCRVRPSSQEQLDELIGKFNQQFFGLLFIGERRDIRYLYEVPLMEQCLKHQLKFALGLPPALCEILLPEIREHIELTSE